jgi:hypothetical protein
MVFISDRKPVKWPYAHNTHETTHQVMNETNEPINCGRTT